MRKEVGKRGISGVVTAILLILLAIAAVIIVWSVVKPLISNKNVDTDVLNVNLKIERAEIVTNPNDGSSQFLVMIKREPGAGNVGKIKIVLSNDAGEQQIAEKTGLSELETKIFDNIPVTIDNPTKVEVYPVLIKDGQEVIGIKEEAKIESVESNTCSDGTNYGSCSSNKPKYCEAGTLINDCSICGCLVTYTCQGDGTCTPPVTCTDVDLDGYGTGCAFGADCDDRINGADGILGNADDGANIHPGATEICGNGIDEDCNGVDLSCTVENCFDGIDNDGNGFIDCNDPQCATNTLCQNLIAYYKFENNANDETGNHPGTWSGTAAYAAGHLGQAASLSSTSYSYIRVPYDAAFDFTTEFTISLWVNTASWVGGKYILDKVDDTATITDFQIRTVSNTVTGGKDIRFAVLDSTTGTLKSVDTTDLGINTWYNIVAVKDSSGIRIYLDGVLKNTAAIGNFVSNPNIDLKIGTRNPDITSPDFFNGKIDEVRVYNRALTSAEISVLASS